MMCHLLYQLILAMHQAEKVQNLITHTSNIRPAIKNKPIFSWTEISFKKLSTFTSSFVLARIPANYLHLIHGDNYLQCNACLMIFLPSRFAQSSSTRPSQRSRVWYGAFADALPSRDYKSKVRSRKKKYARSECRSTAIYGQDTYMVPLPPNFHCHGNCIKFHLSFLVLADSL